jgi:hypothetical protein
MLKKFESSDIFVNRIKTYPKVRVFTYSGSMYYNNNTVSGSGVSIYNFLPEPVVDTFNPLIFTETFEFPSWFGTYDTGSIIFPTFTGSVLFLEEFESGSWPNP